VIVAPAFALSGELGGVLVVAAVRKIRHPTTTIRVDADALSIEDFHSWSEVVTLQFPRAGVYDVRYIEHSGNLLIRAHGQQLFDGRPINDPLVLREIAASIRAALGWESLAGSEAAAHGPGGESIGAGGVGAGSVVGGDVGD
jgi:hypothetical protein